jgi:hypothetical protein
MDIAGVREYLHKVPFKPFSLALADGRSVEVPHPDFVALGKRRIFVVLADDSTMEIEPLLIVSIDAPPQRGKGPNGRSKKRPRGSS